MTQQSPMYLPKGNRNTCPEKHLFIAALFIIVRYWKPLKCQSIEEWINKWWWIYTLDYYMRIKSHKTQRHETIWVNVQNIMLSERNHIQNSTQQMITSVWSFRWEKLIYANRNQTSDCFWSSRGWLGRHPRILLGRWK